MSFPKGYVFTPLAERFNAKVERGTDCWLWRGFIDKAGYGRIRIGGRDSENEPGYAHRVAYELHREQIPEGLVIDHLCRVRHCVNPEHLEAVTNAENLRRGIRLGRSMRRSDFCGRGHDQRVHGYVRPDGRGTNCCECRRLNRAKAAT